MLNIRLDSSRFYSALHFTGDSSKEPNETAIERYTRLQKEGKMINGLVDTPRDPKPKVSSGRDIYTPTTAGDRLRADLNNRRGIR